MLDKDRYVRIIKGQYLLRENTCYKVLAESPNHFILEGDDEIECFAPKVDVAEMTDSYNDARVSFMKAIKDCGGRDDYKYWKYVTVEVMLATLAPNGVRFYYDENRVEY